MLKNYVRLPNSLMKFLIKEPTLFSRLLLIQNKKDYKVVGWSTRDFSKVVKTWKKYTTTPLRLVPNYPREEGPTQQAWNAAWDNSEPLINNIRILRD